MIVESGGKVGERSKLLRRLSSSAVTGCCDRDTQIIQRVSFTSRP